MIIHETGHPCLSPLYSSGRWDLVCLSPFLELIIDITHLCKVLQSFVMDFRDKMTGISVYGVVTDIIKEKHAAEAIFSLKLEDTTRAIWAKLHFSKSW